MNRIQITLSIFFCTVYSFSLMAQVPIEKQSCVYKNSLRNLVPDQWYETAPAMLRVTLKENTGFKKLSLDSLVLNLQLDSIIKQGYTVLEIFATPEGGNSFSGLDALDRYNIDPTAGTMSDFKRLVRQSHRKGLAVVAFDNLGYCSVNAPHFLKACEDIGEGKITKETKWFSWADSINAKPPMSPDSYFLGGSREWEKWVYSPVAKKYYWSKWEGLDKDSIPCSLPQYNWSPEWQQEVKKIVRFWMDTGIDGMVIDAVNWYTNYTWKIGQECITDIVASYGNTFIQPEGAGGFHEDPVPWITEGGWNCVQDYGLGIWWESENNILYNAIEKNNPIKIERALRDYHDRVVAEGGILYIGADVNFDEASKYHLYVAFSIASGHLYCKSMHPSEYFSIDNNLKSILQIKREHPAFYQLGNRQKLDTNDDEQFYAFVQKADDSSERILCLFNFQATPQEVLVDMSGVNATSLTDLKNSESANYEKEMKFSLPAYGYRFFKIYQ